MNSNDKVEIDKRLRALEKRQRKDKRFIESSLEAL
jgi:hypothetical protein